MAQAIKCPLCGKSYPFKPELAGRKVKCKCGQVIAVPVAPKATEPDSLYDLAPDPTAPTSRPSHQTVMPRSGDDAVRCPSCDCPLEAGSVICVQCGFNLKTGETMQGIGGAAATKPASSGRRQSSLAGIPPGLSAKKWPTNPSPAC